MKKKILLSLLGIALIALAVFLLDKPPKEGNWQLQFQVPSVAEFNGDQVTVRNVRNFRYYPTEADMHPAYYDRTYDLNKIKKVWYVTEPFSEEQLAAHTLLSFEFENGDTLAISIEAKKEVGQEYSIVKGMFHNFPLMYIATDERDAVMLRANVRKDNVYLYPVRLSKPENARLLLVDMLERMNKLNEEPEWYHSLWRNCTSEIAYHVNRISEGRIPEFAQEYFFTSYADKFALEHGLLDTNLSLEEARGKFLITPKSINIGDVPDYSAHIREL